MFTFRGRDDTRPGPAPAGSPSPPDPPADPSMRRIIFEAIQDTGKAIRLIAIMAFAFAGVAGVVAVVAAARGVHLHWRGSALPVPFLAALSTAGASAVTLVTLGVRKAIPSGLKARRRRRERKARAASAGPGTSPHSFLRNPRQDQPLPRSRRLPRTRSRSGRYRLQLD
jgi:hypothetical protein